MDPIWSILMLLGSAICHQLPERSYILGDLQMPLCARCIGIHLGFLLSSLFLWTGSRRFASGILEKRAYIVLAVLFFIGCIDAILSYSGLSESDNLRRTMSGLLMGTMMPFLIVPLVNRILFPGRNGRVMFKSCIDWAWLSVICLVGAAMILPATTSFFLFSAVSIFSVIGSIVFSFTIITLLVLVLTDDRGMSGLQRIEISIASTFAFMIALAIVHIMLFPPAWIG